jgi:uncharacterized protein YdeI (YjbR/CyaY-like superfamily)
VTASKPILAFEDAKTFEQWLSEHHASARELFVRFYKKASGRPTVTYSEAVDVALCWGWIDGVVQRYDDASYLQRFTPRRPKSLWSQINRERVARLIAEKRMTAHGLVHVEAAKADGRWEAAYASPSAVKMPRELLDALERDAKAKAAFDGLSLQNRYAIAHRIVTLKTAEGRAKRIAAFVAMLKRGETPYPQRAAGATRTSRAAKPADPAKTPSTRKPAKKAAERKATKKAAARKATKKAAARKSTEKRA